MKSPLIYIQADTNITQKDTDLRELTESNRIRPQPIALRTHIVKRTVHHNAPRLSALIRNAVRISPRCIRTRVLPHRIDYPDGRSYACMRRQEKLLVALVASSTRVRSGPSNRRTSIIAMRLRSVSLPGPKYCPSKPCSTSGCAWIVNASTGGFFASIAGWCEKISL